jgi:hypothetical protein
MYFKNKKVKSFPEREGERRDGVLLAVAIYFKSKNQQH